MSNQIRELFKEMISVKGKSFYAIFFMHCRVKADSTLPTIAGVSVTDEINLIYNPKVLFKLNKNVQYAILEHEFRHVINKHCTDPIYKNVSLEDRRINNIGMDCEINQVIPDLMQLIDNPPLLSDLFSDLPEGILHKELNPTKRLELIHPITLSKNLGIEVPYGRTTNFYINLLKENRDKLGQGNGIGEDEGSLDSHNFVDEEGNSLGEEKVKNLLKKLVNAYKRQASEMDANLKEQLYDLINGKVNWREELKKFHAFVDKSIRVATRKKSNRRYGLQCAGKKVSPNLKLGIIVDVSGSMYSLLSDVFSEIKSISSLCEKITVYEVDTQLQRKYEYDPHKEVEITGLGGTLYTPGIDSAMEDENDAILYIGDMDCYDNEQITDPGIPFMWVRMTEKEPPADFGFNIKVSS